MNIFILSQEAYEKKEAAVLKGLMDGEGNMRELPSSEERGALAEKIINTFEANQTVMKACGQEMIVGPKKDL